MSVAQPADHPDLPGGAAQDESDRSKRSRRWPAGVTGRRAVLGVALASGAGVAAARLLGASGVGQHQLNGSDWVSPLSGDAARVAHLLRRTSLGYTAAEFEHAASAGFRSTVDRLLEETPSPPPDFLAGDPARGVRWTPAELQLWWIQHMLATPTPFAERLTLFWHGHFTSDLQKVGTRSPYLYWQNLTWRKMALTDLKSMLVEVTRDPAMLRYLDLATSTGTNPNENYSRELMELFTMGLHYSEDDVRVAARALAGWIEPAPDGTVQVTLDAKNGVVRPYPLYHTQKAGRFNPRRAAKAEPAMFLGKTRSWDTESVIDQILAQPWTARFIAGKVASEFLSTQPDGGLVNWLGDRFRASRYDLKTLFRDLFTSDAFVADQSYRALVKSPTEYMVGVLKALGAPQLARAVIPGGANMGQILFSPPDVGGWPRNEAWISSNNVLARVNFVTGVLRALKSLPASADAPQRHLDGVLGPRTAAQLRSTTSDHQRWLSIFAGPEFQLK